MGEVVPAGAGQGLQTGQIGLDHLVVSGDAEDERDIDAAALTDHLADRGHALGVAGILTRTLGRLIRSCSDRAAAMVPSVSWAREGATSTDT